MNTHKQLIKNAARIFVYVEHTEFSIRVSKVEARELYNHIRDPDRFELKSVRTPNGAYDLYLSVKPSL